MATASVLPASNSHYGPVLPYIPPRPIRGIGHVVKWIRDSETKGLTQRILVYTLAVIASIALIVSIIGSPIFIMGFKELIRQRQRERYDNCYNQLVVIANETSAHQFLRGRTEPLQQAAISISEKTRNRILKELHIPQKQADTMSDNDVLRSASVRFEDYMNRYGLTITDKP